MGAFHFTDDDIDGLLFPTGRRACSGTRTKHVSESVGWSHKLNSPPPETVAFKSHLSYLPHSGSVLSQLGDEIDGYTSTTGALHFAVGEPLPDALVRKLVETRLQELGFG